MNRVTNWVFLGDSITEGVGSLRTTYVTELANRLRASSPARAVHDMRLREVGPGFNPFIRVNLAGYFSRDERATTSALWVWNLASEGSSIERDHQWLRLLENLRPERVFIHRGSFESVLRPACCHDGNWPFWVPRSWRGLYALEPRCYFSTTPLRKLKQSFIDSLKQRARLRLLRNAAPRPVLDPEVFASHYQSLLPQLRALGATVTILGLLPPEERTFPGTATHFLAVNSRLQSLATSLGAEFVDWRVQFDGRQDGSFYRDGLHPSPEGSARLAEILHAHLIRQGAA